ncbi:ArnT family glycosyltransferase [Noviherbaspirillum suwonense]|uniref:4-amino-4-deoxy-L-arabinose transferase n=1 Tax=Noviherbaspirillum suwonense TaxID=1224511 RepID=A0ABY1QN15_9BURK|nr:glycosyltransferase family 39 protein [Noviherbaspirillum suwonense]SMP74079.1 4-amino-4-deoxy-L-arabinose transferase [Noviherbaspirillum suwonense]
MHAFPPSAHRHPSALLCVALIVVFVTAGAVGHDPWKADEAYVFGMIHSMVGSGDWVAPMLGGEYFMEKPPLYYWVATLFVTLLSGWLAPPDAARLTSSFFMLVACGALWLTARHWWGRQVGRYAPLALLGCFALAPQTHLMMPDVPLLAGFALSAYGHARLLERPLASGIVLGVGVGIAFLAKGLLGPLAIGASAVLLPLCFRQWRSPAYLRGLRNAFAASLPFIVVWPLALYLRSPLLFREWFWENNLGRFFGFSGVASGTEQPTWFWAHNLPWFTFPALPLAAFLLWKRRGEIGSHPALQYAAVTLGVLMLTLAASASARVIYALPLMVPLALLAAPAACSLPERFNRLWVAGAAILFGLMSLLVWSGWGIMMFTGAAPAWPWLLRVLPADYLPSFDAGAFAVALAATLAALGLASRRYRFAASGLFAWTASLAVFWVLLSTLWMPWLDYAKSYRSVFAAMPLPDDHDCVASIGLGEGERAMLRYFSGLNTLRREQWPGAGCEVLLVQGYAVEGTRQVDLRGYHQVWEGARPGDSWQRFWLFRADRSDPLPMSGAFLEAAMPDHTVSE